MKKGFTLIELLMVIAIISFLATIVTGSLNSAREKGYVAAGQSFDQSLKNALGSELYGEWNFNNGLANDSSGHGHNCSIVNDVSPVGGIQTSAMDFDYTTNAHLDCGSIQLPGNQITVSWWMNVRSYSNVPATTGINIAPIIFDWLSGSATGTLLCYIKRDSNWCAGQFDVNSVVCTYSAGGTLTPQDVGTTGSNFLGKWHHFAFVVDDTKAQMYVDGQSQYVTYGSGGISSDGSVFSIGHRSWAFGRPFDGLIDDVRVFQEALSLADIQKVYAEGLEKMKLVEK